VRALEGDYPVRPRNTSRASRARIGLKLC
jgi:hypothetical protein